MKFIETINGVFLNFTQIAKFYSNYNRNNYIDAQLNNENIEYNIVDLSCSSDQCNYEYTEFTDVHANLMAYFLLVYILNSDLEVFTNDHLNAKAWKLLDEWYENHKLNDNCRNEFGV